MEETDDTGQSSFLSDFSNRLSLITVEYKSNKNIQITMNILIFFISSIQLLCLSLVPSIDEFWEKTEYRIQLRNILIRVYQLLVVSETSTGTYLTVIFALFCISMILWIFLFSYFFRTDYLKIEISKKNCILLHVYKLLFDVIHTVNTSLTTVVFFHGADNSTTLVVLFGILTFIFTTSALYFFIIFENCIISYSILNAGIWQYSIELYCFTLKTLLIIMVEVIAHVDHIYKLLLTYLILAGYVSLILSNLVLFSYINLATNKFKMIVYSTCLICCSIISNVMNFSDNAAIPFLQLFLILLFIITFIYLIHDVLHRYIVKKITSFALENDFSKFFHFGTLGLVSLVGTSIPYMERPLASVVLRWVLSNYQDSPQFVTFVFKLAHYINDTVLEAEAYEILSSIRLPFPYNISFSLIQIVYGADEPTLQREAQDSYMVIARSYRRSVRNFWTEVVIGRRDYLYSAAASSHNYYIKLRNMYAIHGASCISKETTEYFQTFCNRNIHADQTLSAISVICTNTRGILFETEAEDTMSTYVKAYKSRFRRSMASVRHLLRYNGFYFSIIVVVSIFSLSYTSLYLFRNVLVFIEQIIRIMTRFTSLFFVCTAMPIINSSGIEAIDLQRAMYNNNLFPTYLANISTEMKYQMTRLQSNVDYLWEVTDELPYQHIIHDYMDTKFNTSIFSGNKNLISLPIFLVYSPLYYINRTADIMADIKHIVGTTDMQIMIGGVDAILEKTITVVEDYNEYALNDLKAKTDKIKIITYTLLVIWCVLMIPSFGIWGTMLGKVTDDFFEPFLNLPRSEVRSIQDVLTDNKPNDTPEIDVSITGHTISERVFLLSFSSVIPFIVSIAIFIPISIYIFDTCNDLLKAVNVISVTGPMPALLMRAGIGTMEVMVMNSEKMQFEDTVIRDYALKKTMDSLDNIMKRNDLILDSLLVELDIISSDIFLGRYEKNLSYVSTTTFFCVLAQTAQRAFLKNVTMPEDDLQNTFVQLLYAITSGYPVTMDTMLAETQAVQIERRSLLIIVAMAVILIVVMIRCLAERYERVWPPVADIIDSIMTTVPNSLHPFFDSSTYAKETDSIQNAVDLFESGIAFESLRSAVLITNTYFTVTSATPDAKLLLGEDIIGKDVQEVLLELGAITERFEEEYVSASTFNLEFFAKDCLYRAEVNICEKGNVIIFTDITELHSMSIKLQKETNHVRMILAQLFPARVAEEILTTNSCTTEMIGRAAVASFIIKGLSDKSVEDLQSVSAVVRAAAVAEPTSVLMMTSMQLFDVLFWIPGGSLSGQESCDAAIRFSMEVIRGVKELKIGASVQCGIDFNGPLYTTAGTAPPYYTVVGRASSCAAQIAARNVPGHPNISRDVYEAIYGSGYDIVLEDEIEINGEKISVHRVHQKL